MQLAVKTCYNEAFLAVFVVNTTLLLTKKFPYNQKDAINTTALNTKYIVHHITVCVFY